VWYVHQDVSSWGIKTWRMRKRKVIINYIE